MQVKLCSGANTETVSSTVHHITVPDPHLQPYSICPCWENLSVLLLSRLHTEADYLHHSLRGVKSSEGMSLQLPPVAPVGCMRKLFILQICPFTFVSTCCAFTLCVCLCAAALGYNTSVCQINHFSECGEHDRNFGEIWWFVLIVEIVLPMLDKLELFLLLLEKTEDLWSRFAKFFWGFQSLCVISELHNAPPMCEQGFREGWKHERIERGEKWGWLWADRSEMMGGWGRDNVRVRGSWAGHWPNGSWAS